MADPDPPNIAFFEFRLDPLSGEDRGGTGIYLQSLVNFLRAQEGRVGIRFVPNEGALPPGSVSGTLGTMGAFLRKMVSDVWSLLSAGEEILLLHYPKVPILGRSQQLKSAPFALAGYGLLRWKARVTGQRIVVLIQDLPVEQRYLAPSPNPPDLTQFYRSGTFTLSERVFTALEGLVFRGADTLISPSRLLTGHIVRKHGLDPGRILLKPRDIYTPSVHEDGPEVLPSGEETAESAARPPREEQEWGEGPAVLYAGDLGLPGVRRNLPGVAQLFHSHPEATLLLCGRRGEWIEDAAWFHERENIRYLGVLDHATLEDLAGRCDIGLLLYDHSYYDLMATAKYSLYVAHGMAVLSSNLVTLVEIIGEDGVGEAAPPEELPARLESWLAEPDRIEGYRETARRLAPAFRSGHYMEVWFREILPT